VQPADISAFVTSRRLAARTVSGIVSSVRGFLRYLLLRGILHRDLGQVLPVVRVPLDATVRMRSLIHASQSGSVKL
jgi:hypothetical protein